jgi:hypothetical protein
MLDERGGDEENKQKKEKQKQHKKLVASPDPDSSLRQTRFNLSFVYSPLTSSVTTLFSLAHIFANSSPQNAFGARDVHYS